MQHSFLRRVLPHLPTPDNFGNAPVYFGIGLDPVDKKIPPRQRPCSSYQTLADHCNAMSSDGRDAYMALASFSDPLAGRKQRNAFACRSIWADIDAGKPTSVYATAKEALADLQRFVGITGLSPSVLVSSGKGLHVYWTFAENVPATLWVQIAHLFHTLCKQEGLDVDPSRAEELASVLRLPGTIHQKSGATVTLLGDSGCDWSAKDFTAKVASLIRPGTVLTPKVVKTTPPAMATPGGLPQTLEAWTPDPPSSDAEIIARNCPQILTMGLGPEPQWFHAMSVLRRCVNGNEWAHKLSSMDTVRYNYADTEAKYWRAEEDAPALCTTFDDAQPGLCQKCLFKGRVKTPVQLSRVASAPPPAPILVQPVHSVQSYGEMQELDVLLGAAPTLDMPSQWTYQYIPIAHPSFKVDSRGIIWMQSSKDSNGSWVTTESVICTTQLYFKHGIYKMADQRPQRSYVFDAIHPDGKVEELRLITEEDLAPQGIMRWFNNAKMFPTGPAYTGAVFMNFINAYLSTVVHHAKELSMFDEFGWHTFADPVTKQEKTGFVVGSGVITDTGIHHVKFDKAARPHAEKEFTHKGDLEEWKHVPRMYKTLKQPIGQLAQCMSFAAPLMKYGSGEARNSVLSIWSAVSGLGKSQVLRAAASIWGDPMQLFFSREESVPARCRRLAIWNNMPAFMDELTDMTDEDMYNLAYTLAGGKEKNKLRSSGAEFVNTGNWSTATLTTANKSFKAAIAKRAGDSEATLLRVMEYECTFPSYEQMPQVQEYINRCMAICRDNFGLAGPEFMFRLLQKPERLATLTQQVEYWSSSKKFRNNERFMSYALALALQAGRWAVEFGLLDYDMDALEAWVLDEFVPHNRTSTKEWSPDFVNNLANYLNSRQLNTLVVRRTMRDRVNEMDPNMPGVPDKYVISMPQREILVRYERENRALCFAAEDFSNYCRQHNMSPLVVRRQLETLGIQVQQVHIKLSRDVSWVAMGRSKCFRIESQALDVLGYTFEGVQQAVAAQQQPMQGDPNVQQI